MALSLLIILMPGLCLLIPANGKNNITQKALEMINSGKVYRYADQMCSIFYLMDECITLIRSTIIRQHCQYDVMKNKKLAQHNYNALCYPE